MRERNLDFLDGFLAESERALAPERQSVTDPEGYRLMIAGNVSTILGHVGEPLRDGRLALTPMELRTLILGLRS